MHAHLDDLEGQTYKGANKLANAASKQIEEQRVVREKRHSDKTLLDKLIHAKIENTRPL